MRNGEEMTLLGHEYIHVLFVTGGNNHHDDHQVHMQNWYSLNWRVYVLELKMACKKLIYYLCRVPEMMDSVETSIRRIIS